MLCVYCQEPDSISHSFIHRSWTKEYFSEIIKWFNKENDSSHLFNRTELQFGKLPNETCQDTLPAMLKKLNYVLLFAKYYIYSQKCNSKELRFQEFIKQLEYKYLVKGFLRQ